MVDGVEFLRLYIELKVNGGTGIAEMLMILQLFFLSFIHSFRLPSGFGDGVRSILFAGIRISRHQMAGHPFRTGSPQERSDPGQYPLRQGEHPFEFK